VCKQTNPGGNERPYPAATQAEVAVLRSRVHVLEYKLQVAFWLITVLSFATLIANVVNITQ